MERMGFVAIASSTLLVLTMAACGGHGAAVVRSARPVDSATPVGGSGIPSELSPSRGWVKVAACGGGMGGSWAFGPYFHMNGGKVRIVASMTTYDPSGSFQWEIRIVPRQKDGGYGFDGAVGIAPAKTVDNPARTDQLFFAGISERPLRAGGYRTAIMGTSGEYTLTVYVRK